MTMGLKIGLGKSCYTNSSNQDDAMEPTYFQKKAAEQIPWSAPNPSPEHFRILRVKSFTSRRKPVLVVEINYIGCTNFEGKKVCVFEGITEAELRALKTLDPHFADSKHAPIARFKPDEMGWMRAMAFAKTVK